MKKILGFLAVAGLLFVAAPSGPAQAFSLANPGTAAAAKHVSDGMTTNVEWRHHRAHRHHHARRHHGWHRHPRVHRRHVHRHHRHHHHHHRHHRH